MSYDNASTGTSTISGTSVTSAVSRDFREHRDRQRHRTQQQLLQAAVVGVAAKQARPTRAARTAAPRPTTHRCRPRAAASVVGDSANGNSVTTMMKKISGFDELAPAAKGDAQIARQDGAERVHHVKLDHQRAAARELVRLMRRDHGERHPPRGAGASNRRAVARPSLSRFVVGSSSIHSLAPDSLQHRERDAPLLPGRQVRARAYERPRSSFSSASNGVERGARPPQSAA